MPIKTATTKAASSTAAAHRHRQLEVADAAKLNLNSVHHIDTGCGLVFDVVARKLTHNAAGRSFTVSVICLAGDFK